MLRDDLLFLVAVLAVLLLIMDLFSRLLIGTT